MKKIFCAAAMLALLGCGNPERSCEIKVGGTAKEALVTYMIGSSQNQQTVPLPWSHTFKHADPYAPISVSAQNQGTGTITVDVIADGKTLKSGSASNEYGVASAAASLSEF